eukprot:CAMPEP_0174728128 /NCGR_PEP_ID=MMETSP1094-20130205/51144_1 /TAXON_ID=156173 /ORGANISM="Chrysochromulina brevifilum, Strain UTEX LB 985" /LENGTH=200 /DNA_ID=CAMNT_0015929993 /DNA_START=456 /DNA_END=1057 /DNA_ORIENTATION=+
MDGALPSLPPLQPPTLSPPPPLLSPSLPLLPFFLTTVVDAFSSVDNVQMCPVSIAAEEGGMHIDRDAQICSVQQKGKPNENFQPKQTDKKQLLDDLKKEECGEWVNYVKSALTIASGADSTAARGSACDALQRLAGQHVEKYVLQHTVEAQEIGVNEHSDDGWQHDGQQHDGQELDDGQGHGEVHATAQTAAALWSAPRW